MAFLTDFLGPEHTLTWWQECDRAVVIFVYGLILVRLAGRRVFGKWAALDIIVSIMVGSNLSRALTGSASMAGTLAATTLMMALHYVLAQAAARWSFASRILEGRPKEIARDGKLHQERRLAEAVSQNDLDEALRSVQVEGLEKTKRVVLESSGKISVLKG